MHLAFQLQQPLANPIQQSERRPRPRARLRRRQLCGSPSGSPSPQHEEGGSSLAAGASSMEQSLKAQVRSEVERYALTEGVLRRLVKERGKVFSDGGARAAIDSLCKHIVNAKSKSFTTHYALQDYRGLGKGGTRQHQDSQQKLGETAQVQRRQWS